MANHASAKKSIRKIKTQTAINRMRISEIRTAVKKVELAVLGNDKQQAVDFFRKAQSSLMKGVTKGVLKFNTVSRKIKRLSAKVKSLS